MVLSSINITITSSRGKDFPTSDRGVTETPRSYFCLITIVSAIPQQPSEIWSRGNYDRRKYDRMVEHNYDIIRVYVLVYIYWLQIYIYENANNIPKNYMRMSSFPQQTYILYANFGWHYLTIPCKYLKKNKLCECKDIHSKHILCKYRMNGSAALIIDETAEKGSHWASE